MACIFFAGSVPAIAQVVQEDIESLSHVVNQRVGTFSIDVYKRALISVAETVLQAPPHIL